VEGLAGEAGKIDRDVGALEGGLDVRPADRLFG
jgi:hypothetical protein